MARGKHRRNAPVALMAAAFTLLAAGGIVATTGTADAESGAREGREGTESAVACRPEQVIALDDLLAQSSDQRVVTLVADQDGRDRARGSERSSGCANDAASDARPVVKNAADPRGDSDGKRNGRKERGKKRGGKNNEGKNNEGKNNKDRNNEAKNNAAVEFPGREKAGGPNRRDFVSIEQVRPNVREIEVKNDGSTGTFTSPCGTNAEGHHNSDNFMVAPGKRNGAQHVHDYVGNLSTNAFSTDESLHAAGTTCTNGDLSTYFWPVLRNTDAKGPDALVDGGGLDGNFGEILRPVSAQLQFRGNPTSQVTPLPDDLTILTGDAKAATNGDDNANAAWTCTGFEDRITTEYPLCPQGSQLMRILDFPSCWDGNNLDSADHRAHVVFPRRDGSCRSGTVAIPQLRITLTYDQPAGRNFALDSFPEQRHKAITDHGDFMAIMPEALLKQMADCINTGKTC
ncbi:MAG: DUF1996 domain-containing protein [Pseudonocardiaceae bacterium]